MTNGHIYPNLQGLFANYGNLRPAQNWGLLQLTRTKYKANTFNVLCIARATISLRPIPNVVQGSPLAPPPPFFPSPFPLRPTTSSQLWFGIHRGICPLIAGTRMMVIQMLIVVGLRARNNFPLLPLLLALSTVCRHKGAQGKDRDTRKQRGKKSFSRLI